jgi:hypothetical protein
MYLYSISKLSSYGPPFGLCLLWGTSTLGFGAAVYGPKPSSRALPAFTCMKAVAIKAPSRICLAKILFAAPAYFTRSRKLLRYCYGSYPVSKLCLKSPPLNLLSRASLAYGPIQSRSLHSQHKLILVILGEPPHLHPQFPRHSRTNRE